MSKEYIKPGDLVIVNKDIPNRPVMIVSEIVKFEKATGKTETSGIFCFWFDTTGRIQKEVFNFKDLSIC